jgi:hypothetical protein
MMNDRSRPGGRPGIYALTTIEIDLAVRAVGRPAIADECRWMG